MAKLRESQGDMVLKTVRRVHRCKGGKDRIGIVGVAIGFVREVDRPHFDECRVGPPATASLLGKPSFVASLDDYGEATGR